MQTPRPELTLSAALLLVLIVAVAYLATHVAFDWIARRYLIVSGAEYLVLGILLGPYVSGLLSTPVLESFAPLITLAVGWFGAAVGARLSLRVLVSIPGVHYRLAFGQAVATLAVVSALEFVALRFAFDLAVGHALVPALALGAVAVASTPYAAGVIARSMNRASPIVRLLDTAAVVDAFVAIVTIGVLLCIERPDLTGRVRPLTATEWFAITVAIGAVGGALFHLFLGDETNPDRLFVALAGSIILASGAAAYLELSPLLTAMIVGAILINTSRNNDAVASVLTKGQRPFYFVLLIFAGASWNPTAASWLGVVLFLATRAAGKVGGGRLSARVTRTLTMVGPRWGWALIGQGGLALAIALDYLRHDAALFPNLVFTSAVVSVLLTDVLSARFARAVTSPFLESSEHDRLASDNAKAPAVQP
jgi:hypothetical protein